MMWWTTPPYAVPIPCPSLETAVVGLWSRAERTMSDLVDGSATTSIKRHFLELMTLHYHRAVPRYAITAGHHHDWIRYRFALLETHHDLLSRAGRTVVVNLNIRSREHPQPFKPLYPMTPTDDDRVAKEFLDTKHLLDPLDGDVCGYLEIVLMAPTTAVFSYHLFPLRDP